MFESEIESKIALCEIFSHTPFYTSLDYHLKTNPVIVSFFFESSKNEKIIEYHENTIYENVFREYKNRNLLEDYPSVQ